MRSTSLIHILFAAAALLVPALLSTRDSSALRSTADQEASPAAVDELAPPPGVCPVFCSSDAFCNAGCPTDSLCRNHRCVQF
jgi:hypothetical protein